MFGFVGKFGIAIFSALATFFLFIMIYRLNNGVDAFIGISDIAQFFSTYSDKVSTAWNELVNDFKAIFNDFFSSFQELPDMSQINSSNWGDFFDAIFNGLRYLGNILYTTFRLLFFPLFLIYDIVKYVVALFSFFYSFFDFLLLV